MLNFRQLDLNLLRVLAAIHQTGSVTDAARQLALSQPALSHALARLRVALGDELYVRSPRGLQPTRAAERIAPEVIALLQRLEGSLSVADTFEPATTQAHWRLSLSDLGEMMFLPPLAGALRELSPGSRLTNNPVAAADVSAGLEARDIDLAIGILQPRHRDIRSEVLFEEHYVAVAAAAWRPMKGTAGRKLDPRQLAACALAVAAPSATFHGGVEKMLKARHLDARVVVRARHFGALPDLITRADLIAIVPLMYARALLPRYPLRIWELPGQVPTYEVRMVWHRSTANDPQQLWLRDVGRRLLQQPSNGKSGLQVPARK
jgi:DNA-binding transcriptional LysR family regulator